MKKIVFACTFLLGVFCATAQDKSKALDSLFTKLYNEKKFFGNVLIAEKGAVVYQQSFGKANVAANTDLNAETVFELASVSKQFTAMGIMLLKKQGKLSYDDSLRKFIPALPYYNITVRQLLHHTSGLPDYMDLFSNNWDTTKIATNQDMIDMLVKYRPAVLFSPGEKWEYSNTGYALLASIIEKVSGMSYGDYLAKYIFKPLGMKRTSVYRRRFEKKVIPNYALGYVFDAGSKQFMLPDSLAATASMVYCLDGIVGDGTVNSTTNDLLKWDRALYTEQLVPADMMKEALESGRLNSRMKTNYAFGWMISEPKGNGKVINHTGSWPGYATLIERHLDSDKTIILLRNHETPLTILQKVRNILYDVKEQPKKEEAVTNISTADTLQQYAGEYELAPGFTITISVTDNKLFAQATGQEKFEVFAEKKDLYFLKVVEAKLQFNRDPAGKITSLTLFQSGQEVEGVKIK